MKNVRGEFPLNQDGGEHPPSVVNEPDEIHDAVSRVRRNANLKRLLTVDTRRKPRSAISYDMVRKLFLRAMQSPNAVRRSLTQIEWDISGRCMFPHTRAVISRPPRERKLVDKWADDIVVDPAERAKRFVSVPPKGTMMEVVLTSPCHKCPACLRKRGTVWRYRAKAETASAMRTWFGTLTMRPDEHARILALVNVKLEARAVTYGLLPFGEQFVERHNATSPELTKYLKRVRKSASGRLRHLIIAEAHLSGLPHWHVLIHECEAGGTTERELRGQWKLGFSKWNLVTDLKQATYLCKYLTKAASARVRASKRYGQPTA